MTVKEGFDKLDELNKLYDDFVVFTDSYKEDDFFPLLQDICIALSDYRSFLKSRIDNTYVFF